MGSRLKVWVQSLGRVAIMPGFVAHRPAGQFGKRLTILSVDGGGVRGLISATVLAELEGQLQRLDGPEARLVDYFDVISGTNFGGLITSMISSPRAEGSNRPLFTAREVVQFFQTHAYEIFPQGRDPSGQTRRNFMALKGPKYFSRGLRHLLDQVFESDPLLDRALTSVIIPAFDTKLQQPILFSSWQARRDPLENPPIKTVCCGTTAVPTHFPPIHFTLTDTSREPNQTREFNLINGEVAVHNPAYVAIAQAIKESHADGTVAKRVDCSNLNNILVLSLGTGQHTMGYDATNVAKWGTVEWLDNNGEARLVDTVFNAKGDMVDYSLSILFQSQHCASNYLRIQADNLNGPLASLNDTSESNLRNLTAAANRLLDEPASDRDYQTGKVHPDLCKTNREALKRFAGWLSAERNTRFAAEPPPAPVKRAPPPVVMESPLEAARPQTAEEKPSEELAAPAAEEIKPKPPVAAATEGQVLAPKVKSKPIDEGITVTKKERKANAYVIFPYVPRAAYFDESVNTQRVNTSYVPYSEPAYRATYSNDHTSSYNSGRRTSHNPTSRNPSSRNSSYSSSSYDTSNRVPSYIPSLFDDTYRRSPYRPVSDDHTYSTSYPDSSYETPFSSYSRPSSYGYSQAHQSYGGSSSSSHTSSRGSHSLDPRYDSSAYRPSYAPNTAVTASACERPSYESKSTSFAATPEPTQRASYGNTHSSSSSSYSLPPYRNSSWAGTDACGSRAVPDLFRFFS